MMMSGYAAHPLGASPTDESSSSVTACRRCRKQKLRCSRDLPACKRCHDLSAVCDYPPPPDRKLLAVQRRQDAKMRACRQPEGLQHQRSKTTGSSSLSDSVNKPLSRSEQGDAATLLESRKSAGISPENIRGGEPPLQASLHRTLLPSPEVAIILIEIYFRRLYNANLLFHKRTFLNDYALNRVPDFLALSVFALASIFLRQSISGPPGRFEDEDEDGVDLGISMLSGADSTKQGLEWATVASQRALMQSDVPRMATVQACQNLGLYWFSQGQFERTHIHTVIAYKTAKLLNLHIQQKTNDQWADEAARRAFWACWITSCISQDNANFKVEPWKETIGLYFPSDEDSYAAGSPKAVGFFDENGSFVTEESLPNQQPSIMAEQVKLFSLWWEIQHYVKTCNSTPSERINNPKTISLKFATFFELDRRLSLVYENLHPDLRYLDASTFTSTKADPYKLFQLHCLYRLCACALHSSVVPLFSSTPSTNTTASYKLVRLSAEEAVKHATIALNMATAFLSTIRPDISRLPSITGFAMYVASVIHVKSLVAQRKLSSSPSNTTNSSHIRRLRAAVSILARLKDYWVTLNGLWAQLRALFLVATGLPLECVRNASTRARSDSNEDDLPTNYEKIAAAKNTPQDGASDLHTYVADQEAKRSPTSESGVGRGETESTQNSPIPSAALQDGQGKQSLPVFRRRSVVRGDGGESGQQQQQQQQQPDPPNILKETETLTPFPPPLHTLQQLQKPTNSQNYSPLQQNSCPQYRPSHPHSTQKQHYTIIQPPSSISTVAEEPSSSYARVQGFSPMTGHGDPDVIAMDMEVDMYGGSGGGVGAGGGAGGGPENWWDRAFVPGLSAELDAGAGGEMGWNGQGGEVGSGYIDGNGWRMEGFSFC